MGQVVSGGPVEPGKWKITKTRKAGLVQMKPTWFVNDTVYKSGAPPLPQRLGTGARSSGVDETNSKFFWQPYVFSGSHFKGARVILRVRPWACRNNVSILFILFLRFFFFFLGCWIIFGIFAEFVTILFLFFVLVFWPQGMWNPSSHIRDGRSSQCRTVCRCMNTCSYYFNTHH